MKRALAAIVLLAASPAAAAEVNVKTAAELTTAIGSAKAGDTIVLAAGTYRANGFTCNANGSADAPIVVKSETPLAAKIEFDGVEGFKVGGAHWRFEGLDIKGVCADDSDCEHAFHVTGGATFFVLRGNRIVDFNAQLKANANKDGSGAWRMPHDGLLEGNEVYDTRARNTSNPVTKFNIDTGDRWIVRGNYIHDYEKGSGDHVSYGSFMKSGGKNGVYEKNLVACSTGPTSGTRIGLSFGGGGTDPRYCFPGFDASVPCAVEHEGGTLRNNIIASCTDVGVYLNRSKSTKVLHNTLIATTGIDFRFATTTGEAHGNLLASKIRGRDGGAFTGTDNLLEVTDWSFYTDASKGDLRLKGSVDALVGKVTAPTVTDDYCGRARAGAPHDFGALESSLGDCPTLFGTVMPPADAGVTDAAPGSDAAPGADAGPGEEAGATPSGDEDMAGSCTYHAPAANGSFLALGALAIVMLRRRRLAAVALVTLVGCDGQIGGVTPSQRAGARAAAEDAGESELPENTARPTPLPASRLLRRAMLTLVGETPTSDDYAALLALPTEAERLASVDAKIDALLSSPKFYRRVVDFGHDWFRGGAYINGGNNEGLWRGDGRAALNTCAKESKHPGARYGGYWNTSGVGKICDDQEPDGTPIGKPVVNVIAPWWDPANPITVLGRAGTGVRSDPSLKDPDCSHVGWTIYQASLAGGSCSCGPNLIYCMDSSYSPTWNDSEAAMARQAWDEPARFLGHLAWYDRPLTDLVLANYSVAPSSLQAMYVGIGRMNSKHAALDDDDSWWNPAKRTGLADPEHEAGGHLAWREFVVETRNPMMLSLAGNTPSGDLSRTYTFDPRKDAGEPLGIPSAGVLTMAESFSTTPRERVRAARWLENLACRNFVPPPPTATFNAYDRDPAREGSCQYCHTTIDPAAIHFKRWTFGGSNLSMIAGIGPWRLEHLESWGTPRLRFDQEFLPNTLMTPVTEAQLAANPNAKLIDFLPSDQQLFGQASDGTVGPLGFGKLLVKSGEFDRCATQKIYERIVGRRLDPAKEQAYIEKLAAEFVSSKRVLRTFIKTLVATPEFRGGL